MFWESGRSLEVFGIKSRRRATHVTDDLTNDKALVDGAAEDAQHMAQTNNGLRVLGVSKTFDSNKAVNQISFGILPSERFALLGYVFT